jgi:hypothetical protein
MLHGVWLLVLAVVVGRVMASRSIVRPGLIAVDEVLVGDVVEGDAVHGLEEDTRELVAGEIVQPAEHHLVIEVLRGRERDRVRERGERRTG